MEYHKIVWYYDSCYFLKYFLFENASKYYFLFFKIYFLHQYIKTI